MMLENGIVAFIAAQSSKNHYHSKCKNYNNQNIDYNKNQTCTH